MNNIDLKIIETNIKDQINSKYVAPIVLAASPGVGKAILDSELVLTPRGFTTHGSLTIGSEVIGSNGKATKVMGVFPQPLQDIYRVKFFDNTSVDCTLDHLWTVSDRNSNRKLKTIPLKDMLAKPLVKENYDKRYGTMQKEFRYSIPYTSACEFTTGHTLNIDPYILGVILGDGCLTGGSIKITNKHKWLVDKVVSLLPITMKLGAINFTQGAYHFTLIGTAKGSNYFTEELRRLQLMGCKSIHKFIPEEYLYSSLESRRALLQGLNDTDGHVLPGGRIEYSSSSERLIEHYQILSASVGTRLGAMHVKAHPTYTYKGETLIGNPSYRVVERTERARYKAITSVERVQTNGAATCISVAADDNLYVVSTGFNLTHNTSAIRQMSKDLNVALVNVSCGTLAPEVLTGLPDFKPVEGMDKYSTVNAVGSQSTQWTVPELVGTANTLAERDDNDGVVILLDDLQALNTATSSYMLEFLLERKLGQYNLHKKVALVGTMNDSEEANFSGMPSAMRNRLAILEVKFDFDKWYENHGKLYHFYVSSFLKSHATYTQEPESTEIEGFATPRAWEFLATSFESFDLKFIQQNSQKIAMQYVSKAAALELSKHITYIEAIDFSAKIKAKASIDINNLKPIDQILYAYIINYVDSIEDAEYVMKLIDSNIESANFIGFIAGEIYTKYLNKAAGKPTTPGVVAIIEKLLEIPRNAGDYSKAFTKKEKEVYDRMAFADNKRLIALCSEFIH